MTELDNDMTARMEALIEEVKISLAATDDFYRAQGLDPDKVREMIAESYDTRWAADARKLHEADMAALEQEVAEEKARLDFAPSGALPPAQRV